MLDFNSIFGAIIISCAVVILAFILFLLVRSFLRAKFFSADKNIMGPTFTFDELQNMLKRGLINKDEFDKLRKIMIDEQPHQGKN